MKLTFYSTKPYDIQSFEEADSHHEIRFLKDHLNEETATLAHGSDAVCVFVNDELPRACLEVLAANGVQFIALRCAGFNNVDLEAAAELGLKVARVPAYSPHAVAEHAVAMLLTLNRKTHRAFNRVREANFDINGLLGFDVFGKTVGIFGSGKIGVCFARIMKGFGCRVLLCDPYPSQECLDLGAELVEADRLFAEADIVSLHCPLLKDTYHLYGAAAFAKSKKGLTLINTGRGALVDAKAAIEALKSGQLGNLAMDVYEEERDFFFEDRSSDIVTDDTLMRLMTFPNVLITGHQAFFTREALKEISEVTLRNLDCFEKGEACACEVTV